MNRKAQGEILEQQLNGAIQKGALLLKGGKHLNRQGFYFERLLLTCRSQYSTLLTNETFELVIGFMKENDDEEAIQLMQDTENG